MIPVDISGTVSGESPDCLLLSGTVVGENQDHVGWDINIWMLDSINVLMLDRRLV